MTADELKDKISIVIASVHTVQVYLVLKNDGEFMVKLADIENETEPELRNLFAESLKTHICQNEDLSLCELSTADERANAIYQYDYSEYPEELSLFRDFSIVGAIQNFEKFNFSEDSLSTLCGYIIYLGNMENGIVLFKKHYPVSLIKRESFLLGAIKSEERFKKISGDDIIRLNGSVQLLRIADEIFVTDFEVLERNLGFNKLIFKAADDAIDSIQCLNLIDDIQVLKDAAEDASYARKLSKIKKTSPIFSLGIDKATIIQFTIDNPGLTGQFKYSEDGSTIRLDTKKSKAAFIKLLNDSFLRSELTKQYYEAKAKDNISG